jgi:hypothetical protein
MGQVIHDGQRIGSCGQKDRQRALYGAALEGTHGDPQGQAQAPVQVLVQTDAQ